jgi:hypothetical protein
MRDMKQQTTSLEKQIGHSFLDSQVKVWQATTMLKKYDIPCLLILQMEEYELGMCKYMMRYSFLV